MEPVRGVLRLYGAESDAAPLAWEWVEEQLVQASVYWVVPRAERHPHPRPVWGTWSGNLLHLSVGSPQIVSDLRADPTVTVHLGGDVDVVVVEGVVGGEWTDADAVRPYDGKYDWKYASAEHGDLFVVRPVTVLAWRSTGFAGRDGFRETGRWSFGGVAPGSG